MVDRAHWLRVGLGERVKGGCVCVSSGPTADYITGLFRFKRKGGQKFGAISSDMVTWPARRYVALLTQRTGCLPNMPRLHIRQVTRGRNFDAVQANESSVSQRADRLFGALSMIRHHLQRATAVFRTRNKFEPTQRNFMGQLCAFPIIDYRQDNHRFAAVQRAMDRARFRLFRTVRGIRFDRTRTERKIRLCHAAGNGNIRPTNAAAAPHDYTRFIALLTRRLTDFVGRFNQRQAYACAD